MEEQKIDQKVWDRIAEITDDMEEDQYLEIIEEFLQNLGLKFQKKVLAIVSEVVQEMEEIGIDN